MQQANKLILICAAGCSDTDVVSERCGEGAESKGKALDLPLNLCSYTHLLSWAKGQDRRCKWSKWVSFSGWLGEPLIRDKVRSSVTKEELRVKTLLLHIKRSQLRWLRHVFRIPWRYFGHVPLERDQEDDPGHTGGTVSLFGLEAPQCPPWQFRGSVSGPGGAGTSAQTAAPATRPQRWS